MGLVIALGIEVICFGASAWFKFEVDPDMHLPSKECRKARRDYIFWWWLKLIAIIIATLLIWWYWHPITTFLGQDWKGMIQRQRP